MSETGINAEKPIVKETEKVETFNPFPFYKAAIEKGHLDKENVFSPYSIEGDEIEKIADSFVAALATEDLPVSDTLPNTFSDEELSEMSRRATRDSIEAIYRLGIVDRDLLVEASKYAGPGNTKILSDGISQFNKDDWNRFKSDNRRRMDMNHPTRSQRNEYLSLDISKDKIFEYGFDMQQISQEVGKPLLSDEAITLFLRVVTAHEYGHAVDFALHAGGVDTDDIASKNRINDYGYTRVSRERFARTFEEVGIVDLLQNAYGYDEQETDAYMKRWRVHREPRTALAVKHVDEMEEAGLSLIITDAESKLNGAIYRKFEGKVPENITNNILEIAEVLAYGLPAYTTDELQKIIAIGNAEKKKVHQSPF